MCCNRRCRPAGLRGGVKGEGQSSVECSVREHCWRQGWCVTPVRCSELCLVLSMCVVVCCMQGRGERGGWVRKTAPSTGPYPCMDVCYPPTTHIVVGCGSWELQAGFAAVSNELQHSLLQLQNCNSSGKTASALKLCTQDAAAGALDVWSLPVSRLLSINACFSAGSRMRLLVGADCCGIGLPCCCVLAVAPLSPSAGSGVLRNDQVNHETPSRLFSSRYRKHNDTHGDGAAGASAGSSLASGAAAAG